eukprot:scaffold11580_cov96-Isochrysis_galbana.AAC.1
MRGRRAAARRTPRGRPVPARPRRRASPTCAAGRAGAAAPPPPPRRPPPGGYARAPRGKRPGRGCGEA